ncbi:hypothetical protein HanPSC8_Chr04g0175261 [Helianthus annuus]|nr:hypothetical protein HanPSC8_Chr04g0175261 [Helianthus annuus]
MYQIPKIDRDTNSNSILGKKARPKRTLLTAVPFPYSNTWKQSGNHSISVFPAKIPPLHSVESMKK